MSMLHVLIDSCIYSADRKRSKPPFRALTRLAGAGKLHIHVPAFVKSEFVSQQQDHVQKQIAELARAAQEISGCTAEEALDNFTSNIVTSATAIRGQANDLLLAEFQTWTAEVKATEHPIRPDHGERVAAAYFAGAPPFRAAKHRDDFPDGFIWQTAIDLVAEHGKLVVVTNDKHFRQTAEKHQFMKAYETLAAFIDDDECKDALADIITSERVARRVERIKQLLPETPTENLLRSLAAGIVHELARQTVRHRAIPDDNNEATIWSVGEPENVELDFANVDHHGDADIGIPFTARVDCDLSYAIFKADYYCLDEEEMERISISDLNRHYYDAEQNYTLTISGYITIMIDPADLEEDDLSDADLKALIESADTSTEITKKDVYIPEY